LEIIGEALGQARHADETLETRLPKLPRIVALRNRVIHGYDTVDDSATGSRFPAVGPEGPRVPEAWLNPGALDALLLHRAVS